MRSRPAVSPRDGSWCCSLADALVHMFSTRCEAAALFQVFLPSILYAVSTPSFWATRRASRLSSPRSMGSFRMHLLASVDTHVAASFLSLISQDDRWRMQMCVLFTLHVTSQCLTGPKYVTMLVAGTYITFIPDLLWPGCRGDLVYK